MTRSEFIRNLGMSSGALMALYCMGGLTACANEEPKPADRSGKLDLSLDLNSTDYSKLQNNGEFVIVKGQPIIVARKTDGNFVAVSKDCTHRGQELTYQASTDHFNYPLHGAHFSTTGSVLKGPATTPLKQYKTAFNGKTNTLRLYEE